MTKLHFNPEGLLFKINLHGSTALRDDCRWGMSRLLGFSVQTFRVASADTLFILCRETLI